MSQRLAVRFQCPRCQAQNVARAVQKKTSLTCMACDWSKVVASADLSDDTACRCLICGTEDLWRQKDFPQALGIGFVAIGAIGSSIAWYYHRPIVALGVLLVVAAIDFGLFMVMPDVLVCYRCRARHSGGSIGEHPVFDHELGERYRQEKLRLEESGGSRQDESVGA